MIGRYKNTIILSLLIIINLCLSFMLFNQIQEKKYGDFESLKVHDAITPKIALQITQCIYEDRTGFAIEDKFFETEYLKKTNEYHIYLKRCFKPGVLLNDVSTSGAYISTENGRVTRSYIHSNATFTSTCYAEEMGIE